MVWASTTKLGCGVSGSFLTCRYSPQGNYIGDFEQNVPRLLTDDGTDGGDNTDPTTPPTSEEIQALLDTYAGNLNGGTSNCGYVEANPTVVDGARYSGVKINCPTYSTTVAQVMYSASASDWEQIVDHCDNLLMNESDPDANNQVVRTYNAWGAAGVNTVAFYMP